MSGGGVGHAIQQHGEREQKDGMKKRLGLCEAGCDDDTEIKRDLDVIISGTKLSIIRSIKDELLRSIKKSKIGNFAFSVGRENECPSSNEEMEMIKDKIKSEMKKQRFYNRAPLNGERRSKKHGDEQDGGGKAPIGGPEIGAAVRREVADGPEDALEPSRQEEQNEDPHVAVPMQALEETGERPGIHTPRAYSGHPGGLPYGSLDYFGYKTPEIDDLSYAAFDGGQERDPPPEDDRLGEADADTLVRLLYPERPHRHAPKVHMMHRHHHHRHKPGAVERDAREYDLEEDRSDAEDTPARRWADVDGEHRRHAAHSLGDVHAPSSSEDDVEGQPRYIYLSELVKRVE